MRRALAASRLHASGVLHHCVRTEACACADERRAGCRAEQPYGGEPVSAFQRAVRGSEATLKDHICKTMNPLNLRRCSLVPKNTPGADWRALVLHVDKHEEDKLFNVRAPLATLLCG